MQHLGTDRAFVQEQYSDTTSAFSGYCWPSDIIMMAVRWYLACGSAIRHFERLCEQPRRLALTRIAGLSTLWHGGRDRPAVSATSRPPMTAGSVSTRPGMDATRCSFHRRHV